MTDNDRRDPWLGAPKSGSDAGTERGTAPRAQGTTRDGAWAQDTLERLVFASLKEQRAARRWSTFFKLAFLAYLLLIGYMMLRPGFGGGDAAGRHTAVVEIRGVIADGQEANADHIISGLRRAFENKDAAAVIMRINSPGGSPVQAGYVNDEVRRLRAQYPDKKVYAVVTDICASGGYYIAVSADEIYADKASIVGSVGVLMDGFGFVGTLEKLGVERRLVTAGESKGFLDPFSPQKEEDMEHLRSMLGDIHRQFINVVRQGRGDRLKENDKLFSGLTWTGEESLKLGLIDGLGNSSYVARELVGAERIVDYTHRPPVFERFAGKLGVVLADRVVGAFGGEIR